MNDSPKTILAEEREIIEIYNSYKIRRLRSRKNKLEMIYEKNLKKKKFFKINKKEDKKIIFSCSSELNTVYPLRKEEQLDTTKNAGDIPSFTNFTKKLSLKKIYENPHLDSIVTTTDNSPLNIELPNISNETLRIYKQIEYFYNLNKKFLNLMRIPTFNYDVILGHLNEYASYAKKYSYSD